MDHTHSDAELAARRSRAKSRTHIRAGETEPSDSEGPTTFDGLREMARGAADRARDTFGGGVGSLADVIDERTGLITAARERPLAILGLAFSAGYLLAHATADDDGNWLVERARRQLKALIMTSLGAVAAHELQSLASSNEGLGRFLQNLLGGDEDEDDFNL